MTEKAPVDPAKLDQFMLRFGQDLGANFHGPTILIGEKLGLYRALAESDGMASTELAKATGTSERYVREWRAAWAASGNVSLHSEGHKFFLGGEQEFGLADEE